jgi:hypothetical protein
VSAIQGSTRLILSYLYRRWRLHGPNPGATGTAEQAAGSRSPPTGAVRQLAASRVAFDDMMAFDLEAKTDSHETHNGYWV